MAGSTRYGTPTSPIGKLSEKQQRIYEFLNDHVDNQVYIKSREIAEEIDLTTREVGRNMPALQEADIPLIIESWGYSSSTTWKITRYTPDTDP